jgi:hypothetical protein
MTVAEWKQKYKTYAEQHAVKAMPDRGYGISGYLDRLAGHYTNYYTSRAEAIKATQYLANATRESVDLVGIQAHGERRFVIGEVAPDPFDKFQS